MIRVLHEVLAPLPVATVVPTITAAAPTGYVAPLTQVVIALPQALICARLAQQQPSQVQGGSGVGAVLALEVAQTLPVGLLSIPHLFVATE